jgi:hypothetical protein
VVSVYLAVVAGGVGRDPLVAGSVQDVGEVICAVAGAVVGNDPLDADDPVGGKPDPGTMQESDCRNGFSLASASV